VECREGNVRTPMPTAMGLFFERIELTLPIRSGLDRVILPMWAERSSQKNTQSYGSVGQSRLNPLKQIGPMFSESS